MPECKFVETSCFAFHLNIFVLSLFILFFLWFCCCWCWLAGAFDAIENVHLMKTILIWMRTNFLYRIMTTSCSTALFLFSMALLMKPFDDFYHGCVEFTEHHNTCSHVWSNTFGIDYIENEGMVWENGCCLQKLETRKTSKQLCWNVLFRLAWLKIKFIRSIRDNIFGLE